MTPEHEPPQQKYSPEEAFGFSENEALFERVSGERFQALLDDEATTIHRVEVSSNSYGEFLFCTVSRAGEERRIFVSFYGAGYHEPRERWLTDEWFWYRTQPWPELEEAVVPKDEAQESIEARRQEVGAFSDRQTQSRRGQLFELLADLSDEDGALSEMEDLPWWLLDDDL